ncbi:Sorting nexin lst-4 [Caenorhabditis elegans]|uniref:Isoform d of Sorting nexin lst-4 n=2 Tax=Caenorhabditis elegans TaxID=6239 RepID=Q8I4E2-4|nr:Sorting nexin lst-4 [Caenorhabditis elegans]CAD56254.1 Sorting nexin lst-4 [Caenorhabditis elegans]|eukprot:NP_872090.1 Sorting nexin lst-4 [Caenorhabditis elegans]
MAQVKAEYDFQSQPNTGELSISAGEVLTVIRENIDGGWIEGRNVRGSVGLFPESYVTPYQASRPPPVLPPPLPPTSSGPPAASSRPFDDWGGASEVAAPPSYGAQHHHQPTPSVPEVTRSSYPSQNDDFDDEWTDEDDEQEPTRPNVQSSIGSNSRRDLSRSHSEHGGPDRGSNKVNKNINRFSNFVKSGVEAYVIGESKTTSQISERHEVVMNNGIIQWKPIQQYYTCIVDKPKKESKLKGLKSFIAYSITSSLTNIQVSRRYKHFDWLHEQLSAKYVLIPIPPLPEKQVAGRYEEDLIDHRKHILQLWVNKICRHPVLSQSEVWLHFISCTDEKDWKNGKRRAEKDEYIGGAFLNCITVPHQPLDPNNVDMQVERFQRSVKTSEEAMRVMQERMNMFQKVFAGPVKQNWQKMGSAFKTLQQSFEIDETVASRRLTEALAYTASEYHEIGQVFDAHTKNDMEPVLENLYSYKGTVQNVPDIIQVHKQAVQKFRDSEGRLSSAEAEKMKQRIDAMSYTVIAEVQHQTAEKVEDMKSTMGTYLKKQAMFYQEVATKLTSLAARYD